MTHEQNSPEERRILSDLLDELESVRVGRSVRRKTTAGLAVVALLVTVVVVSLPAPTAPGPAPIAVNPNPGPVIEDRVAPEPVELGTPGRIEIVESVTEFAHVKIASPARRSVVVDTAAPMRHVGFMTDSELIRALRETNTDVGLATYGGRTVLTSSPVAPRPDPESEPAAF